MKSIIPDCELHQPCNQQPCRATKKCWWTGAYNPGAIIVPYFRNSPGCRAPKLSIPMSLTSASIFPSYIKKFPFFPFVEVYYYIRWRGG